MTRILCTLFLCITASICSAAIEAETYADCILENMKGVTSDVAAQAIKEACGEKHKEDSPRNVSAVGGEVSTSASVQKQRGLSKIYCFNEENVRDVWETTISCGGSGKQITLEEYQVFKSFAFYNTPARPPIPSVAKESANSSAQKLKYCKNSRDTSRVYTSTSLGGCSQGGDIEITFREYSSIRDSQPRTRRTSSSKPSVGEFLQSLGKILGGYPADATDSEIREIDRQKADGCEQALRMNTYRKINGQGQQALPIGC